MGINFPASPTVGQKYPEPPVGGIPVYTWDGEKWTTVGGALATYALPSTTLPLINATPAVIGTETAYARGDHVHLTDTTRVAKAGDTMTGALQVNSTITSASTPTVGAYYFGESVTKVFSYDGTTFGMSGGPLVVTGYLNSQMDATSGAYFFGGEGIRYLNYSSGSFNFSGGTLNVNNNLTAASATFSAGMTCATAHVTNGNLTIGWPGVSNIALYLSDNSITRTTLYYDMSIGVTVLYDNYSGGNIKIDAGSNLSYVGLQAYKNGGGPWGDSSDERIKNVQGDYTAGLAEITALRPITYTFKGNDTGEPPANTSTAQGAPKADDPVVVPYPNSPHYHSAREGKVFHGLIAQEVESILPSMVTKRSGYIDGAPVADVRDLDTSQLVFALINAVRELKVRVEQLEAT